MYDLEIKEEGERDLDRLDKPTARRIAKKIAWLAANFDELNAETLKGEWARFFKLRVGDYRVMYKVLHAEKRIEIYRVRHRREVYD